MQVTSAKVEEELDVKGAMLQFAHLEKLNSLLFVIHVNLHP